MAGVKTFPPPAGVCWIHQQTFTPAGLKPREGEKEEVGGGGEPSGQRDVKALLAWTLWRLHMLVQRVIQVLHPLVLSSLELRLPVVVGRLPTLIYVLLGVGSYFHHP